jgi:hypothetical protein
VQETRRRHALKDLQPLLTLTMRSVLDELGAYPELATDTRCVAAQDTLRQTQALVDRVDWDADVARAWEQVMHAQEAIAYARGAIERTRDARYRSRQVAALNRDMSDRVDKRRRHSMRTSFLTDRDVRR